MQTIYLDISNKGVVPVIYAKQNDVGRKFEAVLTNSGLPYEPEGGSAFSAWYSGASGMGNYTDIGGKSAFSVSGNKVTVELIAQMLQNGGEGFLCLVLSRAGGEQIGLWNIRYICEGIPGAGSEEAQQYYTAFSQAVEGLAYPDASLSVAGKAADAAAVGTALAGKAPAGYGLGGLTTFVAPGDATKTGFYHTWLTTTGYDAYATLEVINRNDGIITQNAYTVSGGILHRVYYNDVWGEWEWINPPLEWSVEYRTTGRYNGKPVYTKRILLGALPNNAEMSVDVGVSGWYLASVDAGATNNATGVFKPFPLVQNGAATPTGFIDRVNSGKYLYIKTFADWSAYSAYVVLKYTKG